MVMLAAVLQEVATVDVPLGLTTEHCTLVPTVHAPDVTTDQLALATPVDGAVPQVAEVLLHCIRTLLRVPCKVLFVCCSCDVCFCKLDVELCKLVV